MGISKGVIELMNISLAVIGRCTYRGVTICELGNQRMRFSKHKTGKEYFRAMGAIHVSIDLNGKDGAKRLDLSRPIVELGCFDIVTNFGTSEHVENQEQCFQNIHDLCSKGGAMVHTVPLEGTYIGHSPHHYPRDFFVLLAAERGYEVIYDGLLERKQGTLVCSVLKKL